MTRKILAGVVFVLLLASACTSRTNVLLPTDEFRNDTGYLYGKFDLSAVPTTCHLGVSIVLRQLHGDEPREYTIPFARTDGVLAIPVKAGDYAIDGVAFLTESGSIHSRKPLEQHRGTFRVENGKAYYLGDYTATVKCFPGSRGMSFSWDMQEAEYDFLTTSVDFSKKYLHLESCEKLPITK